MTGKVFAAKLRAVQNVSDKSRTKGYKASSPQQPPFGITSSVPFIFYVAKNQFYLPPFTADENIEKQNTYVEIKGNYGGSQHFAKFFLAEGIRNE